MSDQGGGHNDHSNWYCYDMYKNVGCLLSLCTSHHPLAIRDAQKNSPSAYCESSPGFLPSALYCIPSFPSVEHRYSC
eukprot:scaffold2911_cov414-Prasinococcus_capsulatus_cf.AAC.59